MSSGPSPTYQLVDQPCGLETTHILTKVTDADTKVLHLCKRHAKPKRLGIALGDGWDVNVLPEDVAPASQSA